MADISGTYYLKDDQYLPLVTVPSNRWFWNKKRNCFYLCLCLFCFGSVKTAHARPGLQLWCCLKFFFKPFSLYRLIFRSHTGERPYKCVQCGRGFASSGVLKAHIRTHSGLKAYKCLTCDTTFTTSGSLRRHMTTHSDLRPYMCPYCQKTFKSSPNCRKHMKTHRFGCCLCFYRQISDQYFQSRFSDFLFHRKQVWTGSAAAATDIRRPSWIQHCGPWHTGRNREQWPAASICLLSRAAEYSGTESDRGSEWRNGGIIGWSTSGAGGR